MKPFSPPGTPARYAIERPFRIALFELELDPDFATGTLKGRARLKVRLRRADVRRLTFDAVELEVERVLVGGKPSEFEIADRHLEVFLAGSFPEGAELDVEVKYHCRPRRGLYFLGPDEAHPERPPQLWTQNQDDDAKHVFPCIDDPSCKSPVALSCVAPPELFVLSNGDLESKTPEPDGRLRWSYRLALPTPSYLVTLVVGPFSELRDRASDVGVDVCSYVPPGREEDGRRTFARTAEMVDLFSRKIGVPYPHGRYSQIVVPEFIFGGMENTTATTLTDLVLLDARAALDHDYEALVAHELAHQWWGDLLTCREWSEAWLNEGFATYFEYVWREHARGRDEADYIFLDDAEAYLGEAGKYQRPVVCRHYEEPIHVFDGHTYDKGGRVLHMMRHELGDEGFWRALRLYAERHARGSVDSRDLLRAIEDATARNLEPFLDRWIRQPGHPELEVGWSWDEDRKTGRLTVNQKQLVDAEHPLFDFTTRVRFEVAGAERDEVLHVATAAQVFEIALPSRPTQVVFDPGDILLKTLKMEKPGALWRRQLEAASLAVDRVMAARALGRDGSPAAVTSLGRALDKDSFWGVRAAAAKSLGQTGLLDADAALLAARSSAHPKVRRAVASALGELRENAAVAEGLGEWLRRSDASVFVEGEVARALGKVRHPRAVELLAPLCNSTSFQQVLKTRAIEGLGFSGDERALPVLLGARRAADPFPARRALVNAVTELCDGTPLLRQAREFLESMLKDRDFRVRSEAAICLVRLRQIGSRAAIEAALDKELDGRGKRRFKEALEDLRAGQLPEPQLAAVRAELERLVRENVSLRERLDLVEARLERTGRREPGGKGPGGAAKAKRAARPVVRHKPPAGRPLRRR